MHGVCSTDPPRGTTPGLESLMAAFRRRAAVAAGQISAMPEPTALIPDMEALVRRGRHLWESIARPRPPELRVIDDPRPPGRARMP